MYVQLINMYVLCNIIRTISIWTKDKIENVFKNPEASDVQNSESK